MLDWLHLLVELLLPGVVLVVGSGAIGNLALRRRLILPPLRTIFVLVSWSRDCHRYLLTVQESAHTVPRVRLPPVQLRPRTTTQSLRTVARTTVTGAYSSDSATGTTHQVLRRGRAL